MSLTPVVTGATIYATDFDQFYNVLQQPSGGQEKGHYLIGGNAYTASANLSLYLPCLSRTSVPVSVSIDTADVAPSNMTTPTTARLTHGGFQVTGNGSSSGAQLVCKAAGNYTVQW